MKENEHCVTRVVKHRARGPEVAPQGIHFGPLDDSEKCECRTKHPISLIIELCPDVGPVRVLETP